jgi:hypothetical protein
MIVQLTASVLLIIALTWPLAGYFDSQDEFLVVLIVCSYFSFIAISVQMYQWHHICLIAIEIQLIDSSANRPTTKSVISSVTFTSSESNMSRQRVSSSLLGLLNTQAQGQANFSKSVEVLEEDMIKEPTVPQRNTSLIVCDAFE